MEKAQMVYDNNFTIAPQGPTPPPGYQMAHGGHAFGAYLLWLGLISLLFTWGWGAIRSLFYFGGTPSAPSAETPEHELTKQERKQRLLQYFEDGRQRMVLTAEQIPEECPEDALAKKDDEKERTSNEGAADDYDIESTERDLRITIPDQEKEIVFSRLCAICLEPYKAGDTIVWSSSSSCKHVFPPRIAW